MVTAYANSLKSYCEKRHVGAILTDENGNIISSGFNDAPTGQKSCKAKYGKCYRDHLKDKYKVDNTFKMLDYCRALHAEENAILNLIRQGSRLSLNSKIYTTTFPCNMCANKIAELGNIKEVIYFEPYPMVEAKEILKDAQIKITPFEGATHKGYFRFMEDNK